MKHKTIAVLCASAVVLIIACLIAGELPPEGGGAASQNVSPALGQPSGILPTDRSARPARAQAARDGIIGRSSGNSGTPALKTFR